jgi:hypothetical protein
LLIPFSVEDVQLKEFIRHFISLLTEDLKVEEDYSYRRKKDRQIGFQQVSDIKFYLAELLIVSDPSFSKSVLDIILDASYKSIADATTHRLSHDLLEFSIDIIKYTVGKLDDVIANNPDDGFKHEAINHFWEIWEYLYKKIKISSTSYFVKQLFLDTGWKEQAQDWQPLNGKRDVYHQIINDFGAYNAQSILNVFSTIGEKTFLPEGLSWLVEIFKKESSQLTILMSVAAERAIKRLFYNHISEIKRNKKLIDDFVWLLDNTVELGSSEAYLFRENVIVYKHIP